MDFSRLSSFLDEFLAAGVPGFDCMVCRDGEVTATWNSKPAILAFM